jgi:cardiolipin synthase
MDTVHLTKLPMPGPGPARIEDHRLLERADLLLPQEYIADATQRIHDATRRVRVIALTIADEVETELLLDALVAAARRGVDVHVAADTFTYADAAGRFVPKSYLTKRRRASMDMTTKLTDAGATFDWLGQEGGLPWRGRTHTKFCVVDDTVYSFGGVNLDNRGATNGDYMLRITDHRLAEDLVLVYERTRHANTLFSGFHSSSLKYGKDHVLVDGGVPGDSIIYRTALKYAHKSHRIVLVSQYCPTGELGRIIASKPHEMWFNPPRNASHFNRILIAASMAMTRHHTLYRKRQYLHAKAIVFYLKSGERVAITGSHNFVRGGVTLGTREIALETTNPLVIDQIEAFIESQVRH